VTAGTVSEKGGVYRLGAAPRQSFRGLSRSKGAGRPSGIDSFERARGPGDATAGYNPRAPSPGSPD
jgi:hypothetical protein